MRIDANGELVLDEDLDPERLISKAVAANIDPSVFEADEGDIQVAENIIDWCVGASYLNSSLFTRQAEVLIKLFADYCLDCSDPDYLANVPVEGHEGMGDFMDRVQLLRDGKCPKCGRSRLEIFENIPNELVSVWGQRSGKSTVTAAKSTTYILHRYLTIKGNLARYFRQDLGQQFDIVFTALTAGQAKSTLWSKFEGAYAYSPWFREYNAMLKQREQTLGIQMHKVMTTYVLYGGNKNILTTYKPSDLRTLRGDTRIATAIDEFGWFGSEGKEVRANGQEVYQSLKNSLRTVRSMSLRKQQEGDFNCPTGYMINVSSPSSLWDPIMQLLKEGERDPFKVCSHLPTWEVNPQIRRDDHDLQIEATQNEVKFLRDFGAAPPMGADPFLGEERNLDRVHDKSLTPLLKYRSCDVKDALGFNYVGAEIIPDSFLPDKTTPRILAVDTGETNNSFACGLYRLLDPGTTDSDDPLIVADQVIEVSPYTDPATQKVVAVHFPTMAKCIYKLCEAFNVRMVVWDRWQSTGELQRLREMGIPSDKYSLKTNDFLNFRSHFWNGKIRLPPPELGLENLKKFDLTNPDVVRNNPWSHFYVQLATVRQIGMRIVKPVGGEDDMFRTLALASHFLLHPKLMKEFLTVGGGARRGRGSSRTVGVIARPGGGRSGSFGSIGSQGSRLKVKTSGSG